MSDAILHIKDSYYFELPKVLFPRDYKSAWQFPEVWVSLDPDFQNWEFARLYQQLGALDAGLPAKETAQHDWQHWAHADHANFAKPFDVFLEEKFRTHVAKFNAWKAGEVQAARQKNDGSAESAQKLTFNEYVAHLKSGEAADKDYLEFLAWLSKPGSEVSFRKAKTEAGGKEAIQSWQEGVRKKEIADWQPETIASYNKHLSGKILIPQPFGKLRNLYEKESGFAISKFMLIEIFVGLVLLVIFYQLGQRIAHGKPPKGKLWNLLEVFLVFIRDQIARPVFGAHGHEHEEEHAAASHAGHGEAHGAHGHGHAHAAQHADPAGKYLPLLWTIFFFVLGCNLMGLVPWAGSPTAAFAVTGALALVTFATVVVSGMLQFGVLGFFLNQVPGMDLPWYMAIVIKPMILVIELAGLLIKHGVLAVRLLANMVAGHLVILGIMGLAFGAEAALAFTAPGVQGWQWGLTAVIAVVAAAAFNILELFVAFLQAYIITFLSALFMGAAIHKH